MYVHILYSKKWKRLFFNDKNSLMNWIFEVRAFVVLQFSSLDIFDFVDPTCLYAVISNVFYCSRYALEIYIITNLPFNTLGYGYIFFHSEKNLKKRTRQVPVIEYNEIFRIFTWFQYFAIFFMNHSTVPIIFNTWSILNTN